MPREPLVGEMIERMAREPEFAKEVLARPEKFREEFGLSDRAVEMISGLRIEDFEGLVREMHLDPKSFAAGAKATAQMFRKDFTARGLDPEASFCYYGG